jgi:DNA recombination protein RmuC
MLKPIQESFGEFKTKVDAIQKERAEDRAKLSEQIKQVGDSVRQTEMVAGKLATALSSTKGGGRWGEETLRNVLEMAGLSPYADFSEQTSNQTEKGRQRPDVIIRMPGGRELVIDAKVSLDDYLAASEETDPGLRKQKFAAHAARVRNHVSGLSKKEYTKEFSERVDFVAMFIPVESSYVAALEHDREIFDFAAKNNVIIVTPATLLGLAKAVAYGWRQEQMAKNAEQAKKLGQDLYDRMAKFTEYMGRVGNGLGNATKADNEMVGSFESRVLPATRKLEELQFADPAKLAEDPQPVEITPRQLALLEGLPLAEAPAAIAAAKRK